MTEQIEREMELPAAPIDVWRALTDPAWLVSWLADEADLELWPGGEARFRIGDDVRVGWVEEVAPPRGGDEPDSDQGAGRLTFWWAVEPEPASRVEIELQPLPGGATRLRLVETRPLDILDLVGVPLPGHGGARYGPALAGRA
jgi:uncharacterized protein YndB with AHSA1/START domain